MGQLVSPSTGVKVKNQPYIQTFQLRVWENEKRRQTWIVRNIYGQAASSYISYEHEATDSFTNWKGWKPLRQLFSVLKGEVVYSVFKWVHTSHFSLCLHRLPTGWRETSVTEHSRGTVQLLVGIYVCRGHDVHFGFKPPEHRPKTDKPPTKGRFRVSCYADIWALDLASDYHCDWCGIRVAWGTVEDKNDLDVKSRILILENWEESSWNKSEILSHIFFIKTRYVCDSRLADLVHSLIWVFKQNLVLSKQTGILQKTLLSV